MFNENLYEDGKGGHFNLWPKGRFDDKLLLDIAREVGNTGSHYRTLYKLYHLPTPNAEGTNNTMGYFLKLASEAPGKKVRLYLPLEKDTKLYSSVDPEVESISELEWPRKFVGVKILHLHFRPAQDVPVTFNDAVMILKNSLAPYAEFPILKYLYISGLADSEVEPYGNAEAGRRTEAGRAELEELAYKGRFAPMLESVKVVDLPQKIEEKHLWIPGVQQPERYPLRWYLLNNAELEFKQEGEEMVSDTDSDK